MNTTKQAKRSFYLSEGVTLETISDVFDGEVLDTSVELSGRFVIAGSMRETFAKKLGDLIDEYRI